MGTRALENSIFDVKGMAIFAKNGDYSLDALSAFLSTHAVSYLLRVVTQNLEFHAGYVARLPMPPRWDAVLSSVGEACLKLKKQLVASTLTEYSFEASQLANSSRIASEALLHVLEGFAEREVCRAYSLDHGDVEAIHDETGTPAGWHPVIASFDTSPRETSSVANADVAHSGVVAMALAHCEAMPLNSAELESLRERLRRVYETAGEDVAEIDESEDADSEESEELLAIGARLPIPSETIIETASMLLEVNPVSVYWLLKEGIEREGWRCLPEERRLWTDRITVNVLRLLGHHWPKQIEAGEPVPEWADADGIVPVTPLGNEPTLFQRVSARVAAEASGTHQPEAPARMSERDVSLPLPEDHGSTSVALRVSVGAAEDLADFAEVVGKPLELWLANDFFEHHTKQFKRRPIAWQLASTPERTRRRGPQPAPAFSGLIYYHKLTGQTLEDVRTRYVNSLRQGLETELAGLDKIAPESRSDEQAARHQQLVAQVRELSEFTRALSEVAASGFGPEALRPTLRQYALDDAMLSLKRRWLRRLSEVIAKGPLKAWKQAAEEAKVAGTLRRAVAAPRTASPTQTEPAGQDASYSVPRLLAESDGTAERACYFGAPADWIEQAMTRLGRYCAEVGPPAPRQESLADDPTTADLAAPVCQAADAMTAKALELACDDWWRQLKSAVLDPLSAAIKELTADVAALNEEESTDVERLREVKAEKKRLRGLIKQCKDEKTLVTAAATDLRRQIEAWRCDESQGWESWLAAQPMYDEMASVDGRRPPPATVAQFVEQESRWLPDINDGVRVNIAPLQAAGLLAADVLATQDVSKAIADRAAWRADERRWCRQEKLPQPGWWMEK